MRISNIQNTKSAASKAAVIVGLALGISTLSVGSANAACAKGLQITPATPQAQSDGTWIAQDKQVATAKVSVCDLSSTPSVQLMKYDGSWQKVSDLTASRSSDGQYTVNTVALTGTEAGSTYRVVASIDEFQAIKGLTVKKDAPTGGDGGPDPVNPTPTVPTPAPAPTVVTVTTPGATTVVEKEVPGKSNTPAKKTPKKVPSPICKGSVKSLYWQVEHRKAARGKLTINGRNAKAAKGWRAVYRGVVKGCKPGTVLSVSAMTSKGKVEKTGLKVRKGGRFTGFVEMDANDRTVVVKGKNSKSLYFTRK